MRTRFFLAVALLALAVLAAGCGGSQTTIPADYYEKPLSAYKAMGDVPPLTGKLAAMAESGEIRRLIKSGAAEKRISKVGTGRQEVEVTQYIIEGEVCGASVRGNQRFDPIGDLPEDKIRSIRYGLSEEDCATFLGNEEQKAAMKGWVIEDSAEIHAVCEALRLDSWTEYRETTLRSFRTASGGLGMGGGSRGWSDIGIGCTLGLYFRMQSGGEVYKFGPVKGNIWHNEQIVDVMQTIAEKHGETIND